MCAYNIDFAALGGLSPSYSVENPAIYSHSHSQYRAQHMRIARLALALLLAIGVAALTFCGVTPILIAATISGLFLWSIYEIYAKAINNLQAGLKTSPLAPSCLDNAPELGKPGLADLKISTTPEESFLWKKRLIASAQKSIEWSLNFAAGAAFDEALNAIEHEMTKKPQLICHLLLSEDLLLAEQRDKLHLLSSKFGSRFIYLISYRTYTCEPFLHSEENHVKCLVVDGQYFVMGGTSVSDKMVISKPESAPMMGRQRLEEKVLDRACNDIDVVGKGDVAKTMRQQFFRLFQIWEERMTSVKAPNRFFRMRCRAFCPSFEKEAGVLRLCEVSYLISGPEHYGNNPIFAAYLHLFRQAQKTIKIAQLYFQPSREFTTALENRKKQGVRVAGYFNGLTTVWHYGHVWPNRQHYPKFSKVYEYQEAHVLYHKKLFVIDEEIMGLGSCNLGVKSQYCDHEWMLFIKDKRCAQIALDTLKQDKRRSVKIEGDNLDKQPSLAGRIFAKLIGPFFA